MKSNFEKAAQAWEDANLSNDFIFSKVMLDPQICLEVIRRVLPDLHVNRIQMPNAQQELRPASNSKSVRFDIYTTDNNNNHYDIEMQIANRHNLMKRARYYQSMLSLSSYDQGEGYEEADRSYVIFFCNFDPLNLGLQKYTVHRHVDEHPDFIIDDGTTNIFLDVSSLKHEVNPKLQQLMNVIAQRPVANNDEFIVQLRQRITKVKQSVKWKEDFIMLSLYEMDQRHDLKVAREQGMQKGMQQGIKQGNIQGMIQVLRSQGQSDADIKQQLMKQFHFAAKDIDQALQNL